MQRSRLSGCRAFSLVEVLVTVLVIGLLASIAIPQILSSQRKARYSRAAADAKTLVSQALLYGQDHGVYPTTVAAIRNGGYTDIADADAWNLPWQLCPALLAGARTGGRDDVYVFSTGARGVGTYPTPFTASTGEDGSVGYSVTYGSWSGR